MYVCKLRCPPRWAAGEEQTSRPTEVPAPAAEDGSILNTAPCTAPSCRSNSMHGFIQPYFWTPSYPLVKSASSGGRLSITPLLGSPVTKCFSLSQNCLSFQDPGKPTSPMKSALTSPVHAEDPLSQPQYCTQEFCCLMYP